ncbi:uncharacterized protein BDR25DRAFT_213652 [Lindgomyces ingoldianus]|uniref:Uncharacterized protein n=1 Tax=Lindgomyces ingoldianus TaxID=673940 RepID=A0ACB6R9N9_9PLEO|nr:uncharacterized protein BDR25DRAFT_213652 [Lindgomyces ingoldianus]KAF2475242.1 hypothetical protein BDR25DRAFT_213652 [Lindgomyces ingoldianus]
MRPAFQARSQLILRGSRNVSTLPGNPHIYVFKHPNELNKSLLSLLPTDPPTPALAIGTASALPPTPDTFTENHKFLGVLQSVFHSYAAHDPEVKHQAAVFASPSGFHLGGASGEGAGGAIQQGGMGGANRGGWIHVSDSRNPPDWGRIAWPEDIFGSLEVDGEGRFVADGGNYQASGTYRIVTREGILGIPPFLREKLVQRLRELEGQMKNK